MCLDLRIVSISEDEQSNDKIKFLNMLKDGVSVAKLDCFSVKESTVYIIHGTKEKIHQRILEKLKNC